jgi:hypothetical protein
VIGIAMLSKIAVAGSFAIIYNYTAELFPTSVRYIFEKYVFF